MGGKRIWRGSLPDICQKPRVFSTASKSIAARRCAMIGINAAARRRVAVVVAIARAALTPAPNLTCFQREGADFMCRDAGITVTGGVVHSSGMPALRRPSKYVASNRARIFGTPPQAPGRVFRRAMLEKRSPPPSLRASPSSAAASWDLSPRA